MDRINNKSKLFFLVIILFVFSLEACTDLDEKPEVVKKIIEKPEVALPVFITRGYKQGKLAWKLEAQKGEVFSEKGINIAYNFILYNYNDRGQMDSSVRADKGTVYQKSDLVQMDGNVVMINRDRTVLNTQSLTIYQKEKLIKTKDQVTIIRENGQMLTGKGLIADTDLNRIEILANVQGVHQ